MPVAAVGAVFNGAATSGVGQGFLSGRSVCNCSDCITLDCQLDTGSSSFLARPAQTTILLLLQSNDLSVFSKED